MNTRETDILEVKNISTGYKLGSSYKKVSEGLNLSIKSGSFIALLGPNGCGKSTLLRSIAGLQKLFEGSIAIDKIQIEKLRSKEKARLLSLVLTDKITSAYLIVEDIVEMGRYPHTGKMGVLSEEDKRVVKEAIQKCDLTHYAQTAYSELSDGEKQRVMLARALAQDTPLMMLDEPTAHLDLPNRVGLMRMLRDLAKETHKAILLSTHELDLALQWCDGIWLMNEQGELTTGAPEDLVLNGNFSEVFSNHSFFFDISSGTFKMNREPRGYVYVEGDGIMKEWTRRALEREGFALSDTKKEAAFYITIEEQNWIVSYEKEKKSKGSVEELLIFIKEKLCTE